MDEKEQMRIIGRNIHRLRKARGMTQEQLAEKVNRSPGTISHIETGTSTLGVELLITMADLFSVSVDDIIRPENTAPPFKRITNLLSAQSVDFLTKIEPHIQLWVSQYGNSVPPTPPDNK